MADYPFDELLVFSICTLALVRIVLYRSRWLQTHSSRYLLAAFVAFFVASLASYVEQLLWKDALNVVEHLAYALNGIFLMLWCHKFLKSES